MTNHVNVKAGRDGSLITGAQPLPRMEPDDGVIAGVLLYLHSHLQNVPCCK
jgi:hypothetical protein